MTNIQAKIVSPKPLTPTQLWVRHNRWKILWVLGILLVGWLALGLYLHHEVNVSRAKVAQSRIEESRRQEFLRRGAQYKQDLQERNRTPRVRNVFDGR